MSAIPAPPVLPPSWLQVLEKIETALTESVARSAEPAQASEADAAPAARDVAWQEALARLDDRIAALSDCAGRATRSAAAVDAALGEGASDLDRWLQALHGVGRKLAERPGGAVS